MGSLSATRPARVVSRCLRAPVQPIGLDYDDRRFGDGAGHASGRVTVPCSAVFVEV